MVVLDQLELKIQDYQNMREEAGVALLQIKDLFDQGDPEVEEYPDFLSYCESRWNFQKSYAYHLIDIGKYIDANPTSLVPTQKQLRALKKVRTTTGDPLHVTPWEKRGRAFVQVTTELGADITPEDLEGELIQRKYIPPRAVKNQLTREEQQEKQRLDFLKPFDLRAKYITMQMNPDKRYADSDWFQPLVDWMNACK